MAVSARPCRRRRDHRVHCPRLRLTSSVDDAWERGWSERSTAKDADASGSAANNGGAVPALVAVGSPMQKLAGEFRTDHNDEVQLESHHGDHCTENQDRPRAVSPHCSPVGLQRPPLGQRGFPPFGYQSSRTAGHAGFGRGAHPQSRDGSRTTSIPLCRGIV